MVDLSVLLRHARLAGSIAALVATVLPAAASAVVIDDARGDVVLATDGGDVPLNPQGSQMDHMDLLRVELTALDSETIRLAFQTAALEPTATQVYGDVAAEFVVRQARFQTDWETPDCPDDLELFVWSTPDLRTTRGCLEIQVDAANATRSSEFAVNRLLLPGGGYPQGGDLLEGFFLDIGQNYTGTPAGLASLTPGSRFRDRAPDSGVAEAVLIPFASSPPNQGTNAGGPNGDAAHSSVSSTVEPTPTLPLAGTLAAVLLAWAWRRHDRRRPHE